MQPPQQHSWNNLAEIKGQLIKKLGFERSKQYLDDLNRFLSLKLSKAEFDKLCLRTVGKDNIRLHNQLIRAVLKSACTGKVPVVIRDDSSRTVGNTKPSDGVHHQNGSIPVVTTHVTSPLPLGNGDILPPSPRKARTGPRERRGGDRRSALGPNGKTNYASFSSSIPQSADFSSVLENGNSSSSPDTRRAVHQQELIQEAENGFVGVHHKEQTESLGRKDGKRVSDRVSLHAPLGVPYCPVSIGGFYRALPLAASSSSSSSSRCVGVLHTDGLLETTTLREHMEQISSTQGLQGVSMDCANVVNGGLDAYLKGLIGSCVELNGARSVHEPTKSGSIKNPTHLRSLNGVGSHHHIQNSSWPLNATREHEPKRVVTLLDFRVGMELNHKQLGEDWPILLEKICTHAFEE
ncbi:hypothetical protein L6452_39800 [Arctium lappa]|uniref:Uncharacterized protein n=1 Tax=Arctium lappa TaxID=4217 RepID=A0ACB8XU02_ARCLA|nr:hypothetical protein L6452_39800 [Arctium lappa]